MSSFGNKRVEVVRSLLTGWFASDRIVSSVPGLFDDSTVSRKIFPTGDYIIPQRIN